MSATLCPALTPEGFWSIALRLHAGLVASARHWIGADSGDDCVQEALVSAFGHLAAYTGPPDDEDLRRWLLSFVRHACQVARRNRRRETSLPAESGESALWEPAENDHAAADERRAEALFRLHHTDLPPLERACLLAHLAGEPQIRTAERLGVCQQTVSYHLRRARKRLSACSCDGMGHSYGFGVIFAVGSRVSVYHPPTKVGAALARERLARLR